MNDIEKDYELAKKVRQNAHEPYCNYRVGAVLTTKSGKKYTGCNVANHGLQSICAERVAFVKAISEGEREFEKIVIVAGNKDLEECLPCGYCRQFMSEFVEKDFKIYSIFNEKITEYLITDLLPNAFKYE